MTGRPQFLPGRLPNPALFAAVIAALAWTAIATALLARDPWFGLAVGLAPAALAIAATQSWFRLLVIVGGGMVVLGSSSDLSSLKLAYAAAVVVCTTISGIRLATRPSPLTMQFAPAFWWGAAFIAILALGSIPSSGNADLETIARQSVFSLLVVAAPIIALDAGRDLTVRAARLLVGVLGVVAAAGITADWLSRRGVSGLGIGRFVLSSLWIPTLAFALAVVLVNLGPRRTRFVWIAPIIAIPLLLLLSGNRSNLLVFVVLLAVLGRRTNYRVPMWRMLSTAAVSVGLCVVLLPIVASYAINDPGFVPSRILGAVRVLTGDGYADQSFAGRAEQYRIAEHLIAQSPWLGHGIGYEIGFTIDSPLLTPIRIGWLGSAAAVGFIAALGIGVRRIRTRAGASPSITAWWALLVAALCGLPFGTPFEDRGFGFAIMLGLLGIVAEATPRLSTNGSPVHGASNLTQRPAEGRSTT